MTHAQAIEIIHLLHVIVFVLIVTGVFHILFK